MWVATAGLRPNTIALGNNRRARVQCGHLSAERYFRIDRGRFMNQRGILDEVF